MDFKYLTVLAHFNALVFCNHYLCKISQIQSVVQYPEEKKKRVLGFFLDYQGCNIESFFFKILRILKYKYM